MSAITWGYIALIAWLVALAFGLSGCATAPADLEQAKRAVDTRASYSYYTGWDKRILQAGDSGNCAAFAFSYQGELAKRGIPSLVRGCRLPDGQGHAVTVTADGYVLDVQERWVVAKHSSDCR